MGFQILGFRAQGAGSRVLRFFVLVVLLFFVEGFRVGLFFQGPKGKKTQDLGVRKFHRWNQSPNKAVVGPRGIIANCRSYPIHSGRL